MNDNKNYVVVYVFGYKSDFEKYDNNQPVSVKIGQTKRIDFRKNKEAMAIERLLDFSPSLLDIGMLFDSFILEGTGNVDDNIRNILKSMRLEGVSFSSDIDRNRYDKEVILPSTEVVYNVCKEQIRQAVKLNLFDYLSAKIHSDDAENRIEDMKDILDRNFKLLDKQDEDNVAFWDRVKIKLGRQDTCGKDKQYIRINSKHAGCYYYVTRRKTSNSLMVCFCSEARREKDKNDWYYPNYKGDVGLRDLIVSKMETTPPVENLFNEGPAQGDRRNDKWSWVSTNSSFEDDEDNVNWLTNKLTDMMKYFEGLAI